jgi:hypothetical protein
MLLIVLVGALSLRASPLHAQAQSALPAATLRAGWNLIGGTGQIMLSPNLGPNIYTLQPSGTAYEALPDHTQLQPGFGYWAYFSADTPQYLRSGSNTPYTLRAPAGQTVMVGDPSGTLPATVSGADSVMTNDPVKGYQTATTLQPGQGALVMSESGGTITITPQGTPPTVPATNLRTISSTKGYSFKVPNDWQLGRPPAESTDLSVDQVTVSSDGYNDAYVGTITTPSGSSLNLVRLINAVLEAVSPETKDFHAIIVPKPTTVEVAGADNSAFAAYTYTGDVSGKPKIEIVVVANRNENVYIYTADFLTDYFDANQDLVWQVVNSLQLGS